MNPVINFVTEHSVIITGVALYVITAGVNSMPDPSQKFEFYPWFYHTVKQLANAVPNRYQAPAPPASPQLPN